MTIRLLSRREQGRLNKLLAQYRKLGDEIYCCKQLRESLANEIVQLICPFQIGDQVYVLRPNKIFGEPKGICEVIEIFAVLESDDFADYSSRPEYRFRVKRLLKREGLSKRIYIVHLPDRWHHVSQSVYRPKKSFRRN